MSDTAEYWRDIKSNSSYLGPDYFHIPDAKCGYRHLFVAKKLGDVNCKGCLKLIAEGYVPNLPEGKTLSKAEKISLAQRALYGTCKFCGSILVLRYNPAKGKQFLGCSQFPRCNHTEPLL